VVPTCYRTVVSLDNVMTIPADSLGRQLGYLLPEQEADLATAIVLGFDLT
jgi:mRNA interferase MazF